MQEVTNVSAHDPVRAVCAQHSARPASTTCPICGDYACSECTLDTLWGATMCVGCEARGRAVYPLPWNKSLSPLAFISSVRAVLLDARQVFLFFPLGRLGRALGYLVGWALILGLAAYVQARITNTTSWSVRENPWRIWAEVALRVALEVAAVPATALTYFTSVKALRGNIRFADALSVNCYVATYAAVSAVCAFVPFASLVLYMLQLYFQVWTLSLAARGRFGLERRRAIIAAVVAYVGSGILRTAVIAVVGQ